MADNSYTLEMKPASAAGYFTPAQARAYYGKYAREGVTYHWWNSPDKIGNRVADHDSIVNYLNGRAAQGQAPTVNYVASSNKLTYCINPDNVAWTSSAGNPTTIGVECSPHFNDELYKKLGWLHSQLEGRYGRRLSIYVHFQWQPGTQCSPIDKNRIRHEADLWNSGHYDAPKPAPVPAPVPAPAPNPMPATPPTVTLQIADIQNKKVRLIRDANLWDLAFKTYPEAKVVKTLPAGTVIEVSATAKHPLGSTYYLSEYSFSRGVGNGINVKDCEDYTDPIAPPKDTSVIQPPKDAPINEAPIITPTPTPVPIPLPQPPIDDTIRENNSLLKQILALLNQIWSALRPK